MDALLFNTGDGGELNIDDNGVETTDGLETAAYLSLFCGDFWADRLQTDSEFKYPNRFWKLYQEIPVVPKNLSRFEDAAKKDLEELPVSSVTVSAQIIGLNQLKLTCQLDEDLFEFTENWDAMREKIGADYSYKSPDPEYLTGLRVLIKDGVNIIDGGPSAISSNTQDAVTGATLVDDTSNFTFNGYQTAWNSGSFLRNIKVPPLVYGDTSNITVAGWLDGNAVAVRLRNGVDSSSDAFLFINKSTAEVYTNVNNTSITSGERALSGMTFFAYSVNNSGETNFYLNTDVSGNPLTELRLIDSRTMTPPEPLSSDFMLIEARGTDPCSIYKYAIWNTALTLETLQSWYDLGPTGDPL